MGANIVKFLGSTPFRSSYLLPRALLDETNEGKIVWRDRGGDKAWCMLTGTSSPSENICEEA